MGSDEDVTGFHVLFCRYFNQNNRSPAGIPGDCFPMWYIVVQCGTDAPLISVLVDVGS